MTPDEKIEIEEKVADAFDENYEKHDIVARAHTGDNTEEETEDETMDEDKIGNEMETDAEKSDLVEAGNLEQAWQMFDLAKVIYGKAGQVERECEALTYLGEVSLETSQNITKELAELDLLCKEIQERSADHKEMQEGTYKEDKDFLSIFKDTEVVQEIGIKKVGATA